MAQPRTQVPLARPAAAQPPSTALAQVPPAPFVSVHRDDPSGDPLERPAPDPEPSTALVHVPPALLVAVQGEDPLGDPFARFLAKYSRSPQSARTMRTRLNVAAGILAPGSTAATFPWATLDAGAVEQVIVALNTRKTPAAPATVNLTRAALIKMARVLFAERYITVDERQRIEDVERASGKRKPRGYALDATQIRKLFVDAAHDERATGRRDAALLACLYGGGLRRDEASSLDVADYRGNGVLQVKGKGDRVVDAFIGPDAGAAIEAWLAVRGAEAGPLFVVINKAGKVGTRRLSGAAIRWAMGRFVRRIETLPRTTPHDLRRTFVTSLLKAGEDLSTVSLAARHSSISTTALYDKRDEQRVAAAVGKLHVPFVK